MYTFSIAIRGYDAPVTFEHVTRVTYDNGSNVSVEGDEIFTHEYPTNEVLHLFTDVETHTISPSGIEFISVKRED